MTGVVQALACVGAALTDAMFVGDSVDTDIVGGNRVGMHTALLAAQEFTLGEGSSDDPLTHPDHHINHLLDVVDLVLRNETTGEGQ